MSVSSLVAFSGNRGKDVAKYDLETTHAILVTGLADNTSYGVTVKGRDQYGMQTMDQHLIQLCRDELITLDEAKRVSRSKDLERKLMFGARPGVTLTVVTWFIAYLENALGLPPSK